MSELGARTAAATTAATATTNRRVFVIGNGRLGSAIAPALTEAGCNVIGPLGRGEVVSGAQALDVILLCVSDGAIAEVARSLALGPLIGHCSGASTLDALGPHQGFSMHPLLAVSDRGAEFHGAACAVAGRTDSALAVARELAVRLGMQPIEISDDDRALYHAAASMASNYLVTLESCAERIASSVGIERRYLARLASSALASWERLGGADALTGPVVRGDELTVTRQRDAIAESAPRMLALWDALTDATRALAAEKGS